MEFNSKLNELQNQITVLTNSLTRLTSNLTLLNSLSPTDVNYQSDLADLINEQISALDPNSPDFNDQVQEIIDSVTANVTVTDNPQYSEIMDLVQSDLSTVTTQLPAVLNNLGGNTIAGVTSNLSLSTDLLDQLKLLGIDITDPLTQAKEQEESYRKMLDLAVTEIKAESSGIISSINATPGSYVGTSQSQTGSSTSIDSIISETLGSSLTGSLGNASSKPQSIVTIYNNVIPKAVFKVSQFDSTRISTGMSVDYTQNGKNYTGNIIYKSKFVPDANFGADSTNDLLSSAGFTSALGQEPQLIIEMSIEGENLTDLVIGFMIDAEIKTAAAENILLLPAEAMRRELNIYYIYVVDANNIVSKRSFVPGIQSEMFVEVTSGLKVGEKVILNPSNTLENGQEVIVKGEN